MTVIRIPTTTRTPVRPSRNPATAHPVPSLIPDRTAGLRHERNDALTGIRFIQPGKAGAHDVIAYDAQPRMSCPRTGYATTIGRRIRTRSVDSIVPRMYPLPIWAQRKATAMAATCRIIRLEELVSDYRQKEAAEDAAIAEAISDSIITPEEHSNIVSILHRQDARRAEITRELNVIADGAAMVRTLASTFAITPKVQRKLREKGEDYLRLVVKNDPKEAA